MRPAILFLVSFLGTGCKIAEPISFDAGKPPVAATFLPALAKPTSVEAVLLQLGHAEGADVFTTEKNDFTFDSSERGGRVALSPAQIARVQAALLNEAARSPGMPHFSFHANLGFLFHSGPDEVRVVVGLEEYGHLYLVKGQNLQTLGVPPEVRVALTELGTQVFGAGVTTDVLAPGRSINEFYQGRHETY